VRDEERGDVDLVVQLAQPAPQFLAHLGVERAERLVEQQHLGLDRQRAGQRDALALAAGELCGKRSASRSSWMSLSISATRRGSRLAGRVAARAHAQAERDVLEHVMCRNSA
jgi:electron transfer flavoprotein alpha subunit